MAMTLLNETEEFSLMLPKLGYEGTFCVSEKLRRRAASICKKQGMQLPLRQILFLFDKKPYKGGPVADVMPMPAIAKDLFFQATGCLFEAVLTANHQAMQGLLEAQVSNVLYHCLRHFSVNKKTGVVEINRRHGVEQWEEQVSYSNGIDGFPEDAPNLFDERIYPIGESENEGDVNVNADPEHNAQAQRTQAAPGLA